MKSCKNWTSNWGENWGRCCKNWQEHSFISDNSREAIVENWSAQLDKSYSIQEIKWIETNYKICAQLMCKPYNVTHAILLLHTHKFRPPGDVRGAIFVT